VPVIALIQFRTYLLSIIPHRGSVRVRVSSYPNINCGTYVPACVPATGTRCRGKAVLRGEAAGHAAALRATGHAAKRRTCELAANRARHVAAKPRAAKPHII